MRLTSTQLRTIIAEEVARIRGRRLSEGAGAGIDVNTLVDEAYTEFYKSALNAFDEEDPSMAEVGEDGWAAQVDAAAMDFRNEFARALGRAVQSSVKSAKLPVWDRVMNKLIDGEYA